MIKTLDSHTLNNILNSANEKLKESQNELYKMKNMVSNRLDILHDETSWQNKCLNELNRTEYPYHVLKLFNAKHGVFSTYCFDVLPHFLKDPINVFNIVSTQKTFFREDVELKIGEQDVTDILKADTLKSIYFYQRFQSPEVVLSLKLKNPSQPLGHTRFNIIEIDGFMSGSFSLKKLILHTGKAEPEIYENFFYLGRNRILLPEKKQVYAIDFEFELHYKKEDVLTSYFPFALKHIYLLDVDLSTESHIISPVKSDKNIRAIKDECILRANHGVCTTTLKKMGVECYAYFQDNQLFFPLPISAPNATYDFPIITDTIYLKIPIKQVLSTLELNLIL